MKLTFKTLAILAIVALVAGIFTSASDSALPFTDVPEGKWYTDTVREAYETGLMKGKSETEFAPLVAMNRAEFVTLLSRLAEADTTGYGESLSKFADGNPAAWYADAMGWAVERGLLTGYDDNTLKPTKTIVRRELALLIVRYIEHMGYELPETVGDGAFTDAELIKDWFAVELETVRRLGIIAGDNEGRFNPSGEARRVDVATIALRLTKAVQKEMTENGITLFKAGEASPFVVMYTGGNPNGADFNMEDAAEFVKRISYELDVPLTKRALNAAAEKDETLKIVYDSVKDADAAAIKETLTEGEFALKVVKDGEYTKLIIAFTNNFSRTYAAEYLLTKYQKDGVVAVPADLDVKMSVKAEDLIYVDSSVTKNTRDPSLYYEDGVYYMYVTGWRVYKNTTGSIKGAWEEVPNAVVRPADYKKYNWAPEMHVYNGKYYLFTTYAPTTVYNEFSNRGCIIMRADSPEGPFEMITDGWITPKEWDCIDGTLYVDEGGQPWMVFVHEHTSLDGNGAFAAAKLSDDLTHFTSEPIELFRARDPEWAYAGITDGCYMYRAANGDLLMTWSNNDKDGYCAAVARNTSGTLEGEWTHDEVRLFSEATIGFDGGHGMIFTDVDGQMYLTPHSPNDWGGNSSRLTLLPIIERNNCLVWDLNLD